jgi:DNA-binding GntR family transcriptional regulator
MRPVARVAAPVREQLLQMMRHAILSSQWKPGQRLVERELCEQSGASRGSVREALRVLESEGLVTVLPSRGPVVTKITHDDASDVYLLRALVEGVVARRAAERGSESDFRQILEALSEYKNSVDGPDLVEVLEVKDRFYAAIFAAAKSPLLVNNLRSLRGRIAYLRSYSLSQPGRSAKSAEELTEIARAIVDRKGDMAEILSVHHVRNAGTCALAALEAELQGVGAQ